jgi:hypothetical protein
VAENCRSALGGRRPGPGGRGHRARAGSGRRPPPPQSSRWGPRPAGWRLSAARTAMSGGAGKAIRRPPRRRRGKEAATRTFALAGLPGSAYGRNRTMPLEAGARRPSLRLLASWSFRRPRGWPKAGRPGPPDMPGLMVPIPFSWNGMGLAVLPAGVAGWTPTHVRGFPDIAGGWPKLNFSVLKF